MSDQAPRIPDWTARLSTTSHVVLVLSEFIALAWVVPRLMSPWTNVLGRLPDSVIFAASISNIVRQEWPLLVPALGILLWMDYRFCHMLNNRIGGPAAVAWSVLVTTTLVAFLLWVFYVLSDPGILGQGIIR